MWKSFQLPPRKILFSYFPAKSTCEVYVLCDWDNSGKYFDHHFKSRQVLGRETLEETLLRVPAHRAPFARRIYQGHVWLPCVINTNIRRGSADTSYFRNGLYSPTRAVRSTTLATVRPIGSVRGRWGTSRRVGCADYL